MEQEVTRKWDWLSAVLLFLLMQVCAARLVTTNWAPYLYYSEALAALGTILGLALGASRFRARALVWLTIAYTLVVVPWQLSSAAKDKLLLDRLSRVGIILLQSLGQFAQRKPVTNSLFFVAFVALVFWLLSILAGFATARHGSILVGIIPGGTIMVVIQIYADYQARGSWWLGLFLLLALLLIGRGYYLHNKTFWAARHVFVHDEAWLNILGGLFTAVAATIVIAWALPTPISAVQGASDAWSTMTHKIRDRLSNAVTSLNGPYGSSGSNFFGSSLSIGQEAATGDALVFNVKVMTPPASTPRYYWRARVYDTYNGGAWSTSSSATINFSPSSSAMPIADAQSRSMGQFLFTLQFPSQSLIYSPAELVWMDRSASVQVTPLNGGLNDVLSWQATSSFPRGGQYQVRAEVGNPNVDQLRAATGPYPGWVLDRYLEVPPNILVPIQALARKVTVGQDTAFDKATAITNYLRDNITYSAAVPAVPQGQDPVEWVLFNYKKGFCNYYASAEVLMLRSVGIPARLAVGFAEGQYINGSYLVRRRDAHAWPEAFFPGLGWVEFEPTTSQQALVRVNPADQPSGSAARGPAIKPLEDNTNPASKFETPDRNPLSAITPAIVVRVIAIPVSILLFALAAYLIHRYRMLRLMPVALERALVKTGLPTPAWLVSWLRWNRMLPVEQAFAPINWSLQWMGKKPPIHATYAERAATLKQLLPGAAEPIDVAASELETGLFTPGTPDVKRARQAGWMIVGLYLRSRLSNFLGL